MESFFLVEHLTRDSGDPGSNPHPSLFSLILLQPNSQICNLIINHIILNIEKLIVCCACPNGWTVNNTFLWKKKIVTIVDLFVADWEKVSVIVYLLASI